MNRKSVCVILSWLSASALISAQAPLQVPSPAQQCRPAAQSAAQAGGGGGGRGAGTPGQGRGQNSPRADVTPIPGILAAGSKWTKVWQAGGNSADGILADKDGNVLVAQEDFDAVLRIDKDDKASVFVSNAKGVGSLSMDRQGNLYGAHRTERAGSTKPDKDSIMNAITILAPTRRTVADKWTDGTTLNVRPNDLAADSNGGTYFTVGCVYYAGPKGVSVMADNINSNGIIFSPDDKTLYVTNGGTIVAFDVMGPGMLANRRNFATLQMGSGDGLAVDTEGRLYVTSGSGVQILDKTGSYLGLIPTPRGVISVAFAGADKKTLYVVGSGADDASGQPIREGPQQTAATIYKIPTIAQGVRDRAK
jgi:gluconolactonase